MGNQWTMNNGKLTMSYENPLPGVAEIAKNLTNLTMAPSSF